MFAKLHEPISQGIPAPAKFSIRFFTPRPEEPQIFGTCVCYYFFFLQEDKVRKGKKLELPARKGITF